VTRLAYTIRIAVLHGEVGVIELRSRPGRRAVAGLTCSRESGRFVIGIGCAVVVGLMAAIAVLWRACEYVIDVALHAGRCLVCSSKREGRLRVVERSAGPRSGAVTGLARGRKSSRLVIGIGCAAVIRLVAAIAILWQGLVVVVHVALCARRGFVRSSEGESALGVIKR